jgi:AcrR family transcriptional regulator
MIKQRKTARQARSEATIAAIVEASAQIIEQKGLDGFNTNAVAERAGVSIGSLYQYFPNKDAIMAALIRRTQQERVLALNDILARDHASLANLVRAVVAGINKQHREQSVLASAIDHEEARLPVKDQIDVFQAQAGAALHDVLVRYGGLADPDRAARTLPALVRSVVDIWANLDPPQPLVAEEEAVRAVCGYLGILPLDEGAA